MRSFKSDKISKPKLDLSVVPLDPNEFNVFEIGAGVGRHAIRYAIENPSQKIFAVEHSSERFEKFQRRIESHKSKGIELKNLRAVHCDAEAFAVHFIPAGSLDKIFILYPNPYPKESQANKRWHNMPFLSFLLERLKLGGRLEIATNEEFYALEAADNLNRVKELSIVNQDRMSRISHPNFVARTHFEKKYLERDQNIFCLEWVKTV